MSATLPGGGPRSASRNGSAYALALGFLAGAVAGPLLGSSSEAVRPVADLFMGALEAAGPPVAGFALLSSLAAFSSGKLTRFALTTIAWFLAIALLAATIGTVTATALSVGAGYEWVAERAAAGATANTDRAGWLSQTSAAVRGPAGHGAFWIVFAILVLRRQFGASSRNDRARTRLLKNCVDVAFLILGWIMLFAPAGVFALAAITFSRLELAAAQELLRVFVAIYAGQAVLCLAAAGLLLAVTRTPGAFLRGVSGALLTAVATGSSAATTPVEVAAANERAGINRHVAGLVIPLGLAVSKVGTAVFIGTILVFAATAGPQGLTLWNLVLVTLLAFAGSLITPPISGGALVVLGLFASEGFLPMSAIIVAATVPLAGKLNTPINSLGRLLSAIVLSSRQPARFGEAAALPD